MQRSPSQLGESHEIYIGFHQPRIVRADAWAIQKIRSRSFIRLLQTNLYACRQQQTKKIKLRPCDVLCLFQTISSLIFLLARSNISATFCRALNAVKASNRYRVTSKLPERLGTS